jgi:bile acid:Na+ symporter, BASS family
MQSSVLTAVFLPLALGVIMLGLGLSLTFADFKRVLIYPRAVIVGLVCQMGILPVVCFFLAKGFGLSPELAVGLMLLAASPGGATANPFIVNFALASFMGEGSAVPMQFSKVAQVFAIVLVPVSIGMLIRAQREGLAKRLDKPVRLLSAVFLLLVIGASVYSERAILVGSFQQVGLAALVFNLISMLVGYVVPLLARVPERQAVAIGMEIGIHNGTLAITIAATLLNNSTMTIPPAIYSLIMFFTAAAFGVFASRRLKNAQGAVAGPG